MSQNAVVIAADDLPHEVGPEPTFSESVYFQLGDSTTGVTGFLRLANRPNEGSGERSVCLFLPDGSVAFSFDRAGLPDPQVFASAGMRVEIVAPLAHQRVRFDGEAMLLDDGWAMTDPKEAVASSATAPCSIALDVRALAAANHFSLDEEGDFAANHFDQFVAAEGTIRVGTFSAVVEAHGLRDRSWGPRSWQAPRFYRYLFGASDRFGLAAAILGRGDTVRTGGYVWDEGRFHPLDAVHAHQRYGDGDRLRSVVLELRAGGRTWTVQGEVLNAIPLRNRRPGAETVTRILETAIRWTVGGHSLLGIAEYLDQVVDGRPAGVIDYDDVGLGAPD